MDVVVFFVQVPELEREPLGAFATLADAMEAVEFLRTQTGSRESIKVIQCTLGKIERGTCVYRHNPPQKRKIADVTPAAPGEEDM